MLPDVEYVAGASSGGIVAGNAAASHNHGKVIVRVLASIVEPDVGLMGDGVDGFASGSHVVEVVCVVVGHEELVRSGALAKDGLPAFIFRIGTTLFEGLQSVPEVRSQRIPVLRQKTEPGPRGQVPRTSGWQRHSHRESLQEALSHSRLGPSTL